MERMRKLLASPVIIMPSRLVLSTVVNFMKDYDEWKGISSLKSSPWAGLGKLVNTPLYSSNFAGRYHNLQYCFSDSIYIAEIKRLAHVVISYYGITEKLGH